jgi:hypothetical protein
MPVLDVRASWAGWPAREGGSYMQKRSNNGGPSRPASPRPILKPPSKFPSPPAMHGPWRAANDKIMAGLALVPKHERAQLVVNVLVRESFRQVLDDPARFHLDGWVAKAEKGAALAAKIEEAAKLELIAQNEDLRSQLQALKATAAAGVAKPEATEEGGE